MIPETPSVTCHCIVPVKLVNGRLEPALPMRGLNLWNGWGETRCGGCEEHIKWGVGNFPLDRPTS